jgi:ATP adenylyltransferase
MNSLCCLCADFAAPSTAQQWNSPLLESNNFAVLPSLGSLVEGWVLILPKQHCLSLGAVPAHLLPELEQVKARTAAMLQDIYGSVCAFEHGPANNSRPAGCGVDHAHLHLVPLQFDLAQSSIPYLPEGCRWSKATGRDCREAHNSNLDYLYVEQPLGEGLIVAHPEIGSQIFRKAIANHLDRPAEFNWREFPQLPTVQRTIAEVSRYQRHAGSI